MLRSEMKLLVVLGLVCLFATPQASALNIVTGGSQTHLLKAKTFLIWAKATADPAVSANNGITNAATGKVYGSWSSTADPKYTWLFGDLRDRLEGGHGLLLTVKAPSQAQFDDKSNEYSLKPNPTAEEAMKLKHQLVITEIMWGQDTPSRAFTADNPQWLEIYSQGAMKKNDGIGLHNTRKLPDRLAYRPGELFEREEGGILNKYVVLDRVHTVDRFGQTWQLKGSNGNTKGTPPTPMVSMYRKIDLDSTGKAYAYENGKLKGLGYGSEPGSWEASAGSINLEGQYIGSPGSVHVPVVASNKVKTKIAKLEEWKETIVTNNTKDDVTVVSSTWHAAENTGSGVPAGYKVRGHYLIEPGKSRAFYSWSTNSIYLRVADDTGAIKPTSGMTTIPFWIHPTLKFRVVSQRFAGSVTVDNLDEAEPSSDQLVQSDGFIRYLGGTDVTITRDWVYLSGTGITPPPVSDEAPPYVVPDWTQSIVKNMTTEKLYVTYSTQKAVDEAEGWPAGYRTRGSYRIYPGQSMTFHSFGNNHIYFRITNKENALKPESNTETVQYWSHETFWRRFRLVSTAFGPIKRSDLLYSSCLRSKLVLSDGYIQYPSGSTVTVTPQWVPVAD